MRRAATAMLAALWLLVGCQETKTGSSTETSVGVAGGSEGGPVAGQGSGGNEGATAGGPEVTTASGLVYRDLVVGDGAIAERGGRATVHYTGWLTDGTQFDTSVDRNQPFSFRIGAGDVIRGWDEGVEGMRVGGKRKLTIPHELAYGVTGRPPVIPPSATLVFEMELLAVE